MLPGFRLLDHPADLGIEARGKTLSQAFEQAATGLMSVILDLSSVQAIVKREVTLQAPDLETLLVKWLTEILYLYDGEGFVSKQFEICQLHDYGLQAVILGEAFAEGTHFTRLDVKAVTYHQLEVEETGDGVRVRVFLDI